MINNLKFMREKINIFLFLSILLLLNGSTTLKFAGIIMLLIINPIKFKKLDLKSIPKFYLYMIGIILLQLILHVNKLDLSLLKINAISITLWGFSLLALVQIKQIISVSDYKKIQNTIILVFIYNALFSFYDLIKIMLEIESINPYTYEGLMLNPLNGAGKYGGATGDSISGIFGSHSLPNALFNLIGVIYFLLNRRILISLICLIVMLLATSNLTVIILLLMLITIILFNKSKILKYQTILLLLIISIFYLKVTPNNFEYAQKMLNKNEQVEKKNKILTKIKNEKEIELKKQKIEKYIKSRSIKRKKTNDTNKIESISSSSSNSNSNSSSSSNVIINSNIHDSSIAKSPSITIEDSIINEPKETTQIEKVNKNYSKTFNDIVIADNKDYLTKELSTQNNNFDSILNDFGIEERVSTIELDKIIEGNNKAIDENEIEKIKKLESDLNINYNNLRDHVIKLYGDSSNILPPASLQKFPGKVISYIQTLQFLSSSIPNFMLGAGPGQFSSKVAFGISGFSIGEDGNKRKLNKIVNYISEDFKENHLKLFSYYWLKDPGEHSISTEPFSVYNQIAGEYGIMGILAFVIGYLLFYLKKFKELNAGRYLFIALLLILFTDYWFEHLNLIIIFELLMFLDLKKEYDK